MGDAAHIVAASPRGPRSDPTMAEASRKHISNGIWMCKHHATLVDADDAQYSVDQLRAWKRAIEARSALYLALSDLSDGDGIGTNVPPETVRHSVLGMAALDLVAQRRGRTFANVEVPLLLGRHSQGGESEIGRPLSCIELGSQIHEAARVAIISGPGTGKSTVLQQLAEAINERAEIAAVVVNLPDWSRGATGLLESVARRRAFSFAAAPLSQIRYLAALGKLTLLLDGCNELDADGRQRTTAAVRELHADYPLLRIVISARHLDALTLPFEMVTYTIAPLTRNQRQRIARGIAGDAGLNVLARAEDTPGLKDLLQIPLFLKAVLASANAEDPIPSTKQALLDRWSSAQQRASQERGNRLIEELEGTHHDLLVALADHARRHSVTALTAAAASSAVAPILADLRAKARISQDVTARRVLNVLVDEHLLERSADDAVRFQHHQLQEWYASHQLELTMRNARAGDVDAHNSLREILNWRTHDESVFFACERLASADDGVATVAATIRLALELDLLLAADIIHAAPSVWPLVCIEVSALVRQYHCPGTVDTAVAFMNSTGREDFAQILAPLYGHSDQHVVLSALRAGHRLDVALLGTNAVDAALAFPHREAIVLELADRGGSAGVDCAVSIAVASGDEALVHTLAVDLYWRGRDQALLRLLPVPIDASCKSWRRIAERITPEIEDQSELAESLRRLRRQVLSQNGSPVSRAKLLFEEMERPVDFEEQLTAILRDPALDVSIVEQDPELLAASAQAALARAEEGLPLWRGAVALALSRGLIAESVRLQACLLDLNAPAACVDFAATVAGPVAVGAAIAQLIAIPMPNFGAQETHAATELWQRLRRCPLSSLAASLSRYREEQDPARIGQLAGLLSTWKTGIDRNVNLDAGAKDLLTETLSIWANRLIAVDADRSFAADVALAMASASDQRLVEPLTHLLRKELDGASRERSSASGNDSAALNRARMSYTNQYRDALIQIGDDAAIETLTTFLSRPDFARDAAGGLVMLRDGNSGSTFPDAPPKRRSLQPNLPPDPYALAIFAVAEDFARDPRTRSLALRLAATAVCLPGGDPGPRVAALLALDSDTAARLDLFEAFASAGGVLQAAAVLAELTAQLVRQKPGAPRIGGLLVDRILTLFAWSDAPREAIEAVTELRQARLFTAEMMSTLLRAISRADREECEGLLLDLVNVDTTIRQHHAWWSALDSAGGFKAAQWCLALTNEPTSAPIVQRYSGTISRILARGMQRHPSLRLQVYHDVSVSRVNTTLWNAISEAPDAEGILALIRHWARTQVDLSAWIANSLNNLALSKLCDPKWPTVFVLVGVAQNELRRHLFHLSGGKDERLSTVARHALRILEELRASHSLLDEEPRHPDFSCSAPWPLW